MDNDKIWSNFGREIRAHLERNNEFDLNDKIDIPDALFYYISGIRLAVAGDNNPNWLYASPRLIRRRNQADSGHTVYNTGNSSMVCGTTTVAPDFRDDWISVSADKDAYNFALKVLSPGVYRNFFNKFITDKTIKLYGHDVLNQATEKVQNVLRLRRPFLTNIDTEDDWDEIRDGFASYDEFFGGIMYAIYQYHGDDLLDLLDYIDCININDDDLSHKKWQRGFIHDCFINVPTVEGIIQVIDNWTSWDSYVAEVVYRRIEGLDYSSNTDLYRRIEGLGWTYDYLDNC